MVFLATAGRPNAKAPLGSVLEHRSVGVCAAVFRGAKEAPIAALDYVRIRGRAIGAAGEGVFSGLLWPYLEKIVIDESDFPQAPTLKVGQRLGNLRILSELIYGNVDFRLRIFAGLFGDVALQGLAIHGVAVP
jgi:hypothetical protein